MPPFEVISRLTFIDGSCRESVPCQHIVGFEMDDGEPHERLARAPVIWEVIYGQDPTMVSPHSLPSITHAYHAKPEVTLLAQPKRAMANMILTAEEFLPGELCGAVTSSRCKSSDLVDLRSIESRPSV